MTAQNPHHQPDPRPTDAGQPETDPVGPITVPKRSRIGARAYALVGAASVLGVGLIEATDVCSTWPNTSISHQ